MSHDERPGRTEAIRLHKLAKRERFDELEAAWVEAIEHDAVAPADLLFVLESAARSADSELIDSMIWFLLSQRAEDNGPDDAIALARQAVDTFPESATLREELGSLYAAAHSDVPEIDVLIELTVANAAVPLPEAVEQIEKLLALRPGSYVREPADGEPGRVAGFDMDAGEFQVAFDDGTKPFGPDAALELEPLPPDDFRVLAVHDPGKLNELAEQDPGELVTEALRAFGPRLSFRQLKERLANVVRPDDWSAWWSAARPKIERAPWVQMTAGNQPKFTLRSRPLTYQDRLKAQFNTAPSPLDRLGLVVDYLDETGDRVAANPDTLAFFATQLKRNEAAWAEAGPLEGLAAAAVLAGLHRRHPEGAPGPGLDVTALLAAAEDRATLLMPVESAGLARRIVGHLRAARPDDWPEVLVELLPGAPVAACDAIASALVESGRPDLLRGPIDTILARPDRCPAALAWLWRAAAGADPPGPVAEVDRAAVALGLLSAAATLGRRKARPSEQRRGLLHEVRNAVGFRSYGPLADVLAKVSDDRAAQIKTRLERHTGLSENAVRRIRQLLLKTHHELFVEHVDPWEEDAVYTTETGLRRHREELSHLANEKLAAASKAVGKAAQMGDLSENAEWAAALEARDRLAARAERMQNEINKAKIITREMAESDTVTIGSAVEARDVETDERQTFTFLGPWDVDHENGVHSYRAGFGRAFMGHKVGDRVTVDADGGSRAWEIVAIEPAV